jgi:hypothetical protein
MSKNEFKIVKYTYLRLNRDVRILQSDQGSCTVMLDESKYKNKLNTLLESGSHEALPKDPTAKVERNVQKILSEHKTALSIDLKYKLTLYHI